MDYNDVKALVARWLEGSTTLAEETALREFFAAPDTLNDSNADLPADLEPYRLIFRQTSAASALKPARALILRTEPVRRPLRRWIIAAASVAAAALIAVALVGGPEPLRTGQTICMVNGVRITDPAAIEAYTRQALATASENLQKPGEAISSTLAGNPALDRAARIIETITTQNE
jgi:hypothetical protein